MATDCDKLRGRLRDLCRGHDDDGNPVSTEKKRAAWKRYFHGESEQIGGARAINGLDRDINGARGILLRALTRQLEPEIITASDVSVVAV